MYYIYLTAWLFESMDECSLFSAWSYDEFLG
jgi:hypothetical protein